MDKYVLNYYPAFKCIAGECKHTCCAGWEMTIDKESLEKYKADKSKFSLALKQGVDFKKSKFKTDKKGKCAFLNQNALCDIIINLGEENLCQVCRDHPRFNNFFEDRTETGLGFCCEQATKMILSFSGKIEPVLIEKKQNDCLPSFIEQLVIDFRKKVLDVIQDRRLDINQRITAILFDNNAQITQCEFKKMLKTFSRFERLDKSWQTRLKNLKRKTFNFNTGSNLSLYCEQFLTNSFFRHLSNVKDTMLLRERTLACVISWLVIKSIYENEVTLNNEFETICDVVRAFSAEVEYSQKNLDELFSSVNKIIKTTNN